MSATEDRLSAIMLDYQAARDDERNFQAIQATLFSLALAALSVLVLFLTNDCRLSGINKADTCYQTPDGVLAAVPLIPLALISYLQMIGLVAAVRSFYLRSLEREIRRLLPEDKRSMNSYPGLAVIASSEVVVSTTSLSRGWNGFRWLTNIVLAAMVVILGGSTIVVGVLVDLPWRLAMLLVYGAGAGIILREAYRSTIGGREAYKSAIAMQKERLTQSLEPIVTAGRRTRGLWGYLVLPRPEDLVKAFYFAGGYALALAAGYAELPYFRSAAALGTMTLWIAIEWLIYSGRYQLNDILGLEDDRSHPQFQSRGRLPYEIRDRVSRSSAARASLIALGLRLYFLIILGSVGVLRLAEPLLFLTCVIFGTAFFYEYLRRRRPRTNFGRATIAWAIYIVVGTGYALRGLAGFWAASTYPLYVVGHAPMISGLSAIYLPLGLFLMAFGSLLVNLTWVLDAASYCLDPVSPGNSGIVRVRWLAALADKPHLQYLLVCLRVPLSAQGLLGGTAVDQRTAGARSKPLIRGDRWVTPHGVLCVFAGGFAGWLGCALIQSSTFATVQLSIGFALSAALLGVIQHRYRVVLVVVVCGLAWAVVRSPSPGGSAILAIVPWAVLAGAVILFRFQSYDELKHGWKIWVAIVNLVAERSLAHLLGPSAAAAVGLPFRGLPLSKQLEGARRLLLPSSA